MSKRRNEFQPKGEQWQRPTVRKPYVSADEIIRRASARNRIDSSAIIYEFNRNRPNRNKEMIERLVAAIKSHSHYSEQSYTDEGWY